MKTTKERIFDIFVAKRGEFLSGEEIASTLMVSRAAVWKAVRSLQADGYDIDGTTNRGYRMNDLDVLSKSSIASLLEGETVTLDVRDEVTSTNLLARELAQVGTPEVYAIVAAKQTAGRGRLGRSFYSPKSTGIYLSLLLRPSAYSPTQAARLTTVAAVAMCEAIESICGKKASIKWVNDIFVEGKKVCGILTEASVGLESGLLDYALLGVGVNVYTPEGGFPSEIKDVAGALLTEKKADIKNRLIATFINGFLRYYFTPTDREYVAKYRERSLVIGRAVTVFRGKTTQSATAIDVDDECRLLVRYGDGREEYLSSGEISIRL